MFNIHHAFDGLLTRLMSQKIKISDDNKMIRDHADIKCGIRIMSWDCVCLFSCFWGKYYVLLSGFSYTRVLHTKNPTFSASNIFGIRSYTHVILVTASWTKERERCCSPFRLFSTCNMRNALHRIDCIFFKLNLIKKIEWSLSNIFAFLHEMHYHI